MNRKKVYLALWILVSVLAFFVLAVMYKGDTLAEKPENEKPREESSPAESPAPREIDESRLLDQIPYELEAPKFELKDLNGKTVRLSDYRGKVVFLNFWATWCPYCLRERSELEEARNEMKKYGRAEILTVNMMESKKQVQEYIKKEKLDLPVLLDTEGKVSYQYMVPFGIYSVPVTFIINPDGTIYNIIGGMTNSDLLLDYVEYLGRQGKFDKAR